MHNCIYSFSKFRVDLKWFMFSNSFKSYSWKYTNRILTKYKSVGSIVTLVIGKNMVTYWSKNVKKIIWIPVEISKIQTCSKESWTLLLFIEQVYQIHLIYEYEYSL